MIVQGILFAGAMGLRAWAILATARFLRLALTPLRVPVATSVPAVWPVVTVQLPLRDEGETGYRAVCALADHDYPADRLELHVLDDSTPDSASARRVEDAVDGLRRSGHPVVLLRRQACEGGKAGNLQHGLKHAKGELLAIFDADAITPPGFLRGLVAALVADPRAAMAQGAQRFDNADTGPLQRAQVMWVEGLVQVEQAVRHSEGLPLHFNGSGGVWRREVVEQLGGWRGVCEDYGLSLRAQLAGWRLLHRADQPFRSELPRTMADLRRQQRRWTAGKASAVRELAATILRERGGVVAAMELVSSLIGRLLHPLMVVVALTMPLVAISGIAPPGPGRLFDFCLWGLLMTCAAGHLRRVRRPGWPMGLIWAAALLVGLSWVCTRGLWEGLIGREPTFERTPKGGERGRGDVTGVVDVLTCGWCLVGANAAWAAGDWGGTLGLLAMAGSFGWCGAAARPWQA